MIETEYKRDEYAKVYESILCIHAGQCKSLEQQSKTQNADAKDVLSISVEKGGSSVLADAYLACGNLDDALADFMFGFGFVLQLVDDLQDTITDYINNHATVFSSGPEKTNMDLLASQLISLTYNTINSSTYENCIYIDDIKKLIFDNTMLLIFEAILQNKDLFSRKYIKNVNKVTPFDFKKLHKTIRRRQKDFALMNDKFIDISKENKE